MIRRWNGLVVAVALGLWLGLPGASEAICQVGGDCNATGTLRIGVPTTNTDGSALTDLGGFKVKTSTGPSACAATTAFKETDVGNLGTPATPLPNTIKAVGLGTLAPAEGLNQLTVKVYDTAGNISACSVEISFTYDTVAPNTTLTAQPPATSSSPDASFSFTSSEPAGATFECKLDAAPFAGCASPRAFTALANGAHTFQTRALDRAGNVDGTPVSYTWTVNTTVPNAPSGVEVGP